MGVPADDGDDSLDGKLSGRVTIKIYSVADEMAKGEVGVPADYGGASLDGKLSGRVTIKLNSVADGMVKGKWEYRQTTAEVVWMVNCQEELPSSLTL